MNKSTNSAKEAKEFSKEDEINFEGEFDFSDENNSKEKSNDDPTQKVTGEESKDKNSEEADKKSIYIKNVDFSTTPEELEEHFKKCGDISRITILCDKYTGIPKGYAYIEFNTIEAKEKSKTLNDSLFKGRQIKIEDKRKNIPNFMGKTRNFKMPNPYMAMNPAMMMRGRGFFGRMPRGGGRGGRFRRGGFKPY